MPRRVGLKKKEIKSHLWEIVDDILIYKTGTLLDNPEYEKSFSPFMTIKVISMYPELMMYANYLNTLHQTFGGVGLDKKRYYKMLIQVIPKTDYKCAYIKSQTQKNPDVDAVCQYFECNPREAHLYITQFGEKWVESIKRTQGGLRKE